MCVIMRKRNREKERERERERETETEGLEHKTGARKTIEECIYQ